MKESAKTVVFIPRLLETEIGSLEELEDKNSKILNKLSSEIEWGSKTCTLVGNDYRTSEALELVAMASLISTNRTNLVEEDGKYYVTTEITAADSIPALLSCIVNLGNKDVEILGFDFTGGIVPIALCLKSYKNTEYNVIVNITYMDDKREFAVNHLIEELTKHNIDITEDVDISIQ